MNKGVLDHMAKKIEIRKHQMEIENYRHLIELLPRYLLTDIETGEASVSSRELPEIEAFRKLKMYREEIQAQQKYIGGIISGRIKV